MSYIENFPRLPPPPPPPPTQPELRRPARVACPGPPGRLISRASLPARPAERRFFSSLGCPFSLAAQVPLMVPYARQFSRVCGQVDGAGHQRRSSGGPERFLDLD